MQLTPSASNADQTRAVLGHGDGLWQEGLCLSKVSVSDIGLTAWHYMFFNLKRPEGTSQNTGCLYSESNAGSQKGLLARCVGNAWAFPSAFYLVFVIKVRLPKEMLTWLSAVKKIISKIKPKVVFFLNGQVLVPISLDQDPKKTSCDNVSCLTIY